MITKTIGIPVELIKALSIVGGDSIVTRLEKDRTVYCFVEDGEVVVTEYTFDDEDDEEADGEGEDDFEEDVEIPEACYECPHFCPVCNECIKDEE